MVKTWHIVHVFVDLGVFPKKCLTQISFPGWGIHIGIDQDGVIVFVVLEYLEKGVKKEKSVIERTIFF